MEEVPKSKACRDPWGIWLPRADAIQVEAIPRVLSGVHVLITAPTGSGKTEAAIFPIMSKILSEGLTSGVAVIYITPARA